MNHFDQICKCISLCCKHVILITLELEIEKKFATLPIFLPFIIIKPFLFFFLVLLDIIINFNSSIGNLDNNKVVVVPTAGSFQLTLPTCWFIVAGYMLSTIPKW